VLTRERLLDLAQARDSEAFDRAIDVRIITRIRRKIEPDPSHPKVIKDRPRRRLRFLAGCDSLTSS